MFPNVLQQEIVNFLNIIHDDNILKHFKFSKCKRKIWNRNTVYEIKKDQRYGFKEYFVNGIIHRNEEEGPARIYDNGDFTYFKFGKFHRLNGPAMMIDKKYSLFIQNVELTEKNFELIVTRLRNKEFSEDDIDIVNNKITKYHDVSQIRPKELINILQHNIGNLLTEKYKPY